MASNKLGDDVEGLLYGLLDPTFLIFSGEVKLSFIKISVSFSLYHGRYVLIPSSIALVCCLPAPEMFLAKPKAIFVEQE